MASYPRILKITGYTRQVPHLKVYNYGRNTIVDNFKDIEEFFERDPVKFFKKKLGARCIQNQRKFIIEADISDDLLVETYREFVSGFTCRQCNSFDTKDKICQACGAFI